MGDIIQSESPEIIGRIVDETEEWATRFIKAFNAVDSADRVLEFIAKRSDHNGTPEQAILGKRSDFTVDRVPGHSLKDGQDYTD